ncbi:MAG TPA: 23S rRNA (guanosine(2251)-2'-O)-methyltransferase RlmB [Bryobacteraceae bacterium]|nr:23S rRNA (guanosine(2251)-2'-O)-methyltransferase RlmB [Bryobacteraceae bacterium]
MRPRGGAEGSTNVAGTALAGIHPVREALRAGRALERVVFARGMRGRRLQELIELCRERNIPMRFESREQLERAAGGAAHQGVIAFGAAAAYANLEDTLAAGGLLVVLDGVEDPHNLGAVIRTAHAAGAAGIVIPERRAAGLTETVERAAAGALAYLPVVRVTNINRALEELKRRGYWIYGFDESGRERYDVVEYSSPAAFVLGAEGRGLHEQTARHCDFLVRIPMREGGVASLNVSVAAGVALFEWRRRAV